LLSLAWLVTFQSEGVLECRLYRTNRATLQLKLNGYAPYFSARSTEKPSLALIFPLAFAFLDSFLKTYKSQFYET